MESIIKTSYSKLFKRRWVTVLVVTLIFILLSLVITLAQPFRYESEVKLLVIQRSAVNIDAYSASKSAERIGNNLAQIVYSSSFYNKVINSGFEIDKSYFPTQEEKKRKTWQQMIDSGVPSGTTILNIAVYHQNRDQATVIAQAISYILSKDLQEYIGITDVDLKVVDAPLTSKFPVKPNLPLNTFMGLLIGFFVSLAYLIISYSEDHEADEMFSKQTELKTEHKENKKRDKMHRKRDKLRKKQEKKDNKAKLKASKSLPQIVNVNNESAIPSVNVATQDVEEKTNDFSNHATPPPTTEIQKDLPSFEDEDNIKTMRN